jgi:hypothetical protein
MSLVNVTGSHWKAFSEVTNLNELFGFVYLIHNKATGQFYIGKKQFWSESHIKVTGRKNRKKVIKPSKWESYTGSCKYLNADIEAIGKENFEFYMIETYRTRGGLYYAEANLQHKFDVMYRKLDDKLRLFYNGNIAAVKFIPKEFSKVAAQRIKQILTKEVS